MQAKRILATLVVATLAFPVVAQAQGVVGGAERGAREGDRAAGPVGAIVGGVVGGVTGGVAGLIGGDQRPRFREYVVTQRRPSYVYREELRDGVILPPEGIEYYDVPPEYGVRNYRYTVVNDHVVLVDPGTRRVMQIID